MLIPFFQVFNAIGTLNSPTALGVLYGCCASRRPC